MHRSPIRSKCPGWLASETDYPPVPLKVDVPAARRDPMDRFGVWRPIDPAADDDGDKPASNSAPAKPAEPARPEANVIGVRLIGLLASAGLLIVGAYLALTSTASGSGLEVSGTPTYLSLEATPPADVEPAATPAMADVVIDVEGAVSRPGLHRLPPGSRVGDAIAVAGGYSAAVDIAAATAALNLAEVLADGMKIHVPVRGETATVIATPIPYAPSAEGPADLGDGLINLNTATAEALESLPGVGEVTAAKIIAARDEAPFASVDELETRDVLGPATFEKVRSLVTVGP
jgi:competence protein ComEA